jgi:2-methylisocitrate lyase-like PEP mutase family enzyme
VDSTQRGLAETLRALHDDRTLVLPNAWDAASAALIAQVGAAAIATTSGGVAWSAGQHDGHGLTREEMAELVRRIVRVVDVPVTADIEGGYGGRRPPDQRRHMADSVRAERGAHNRLLCGLMAAPGSPCGLAPVEVA